MKSKEKEESNILSIEHYAYERGYKHGEKYGKRLGKLVRYIMDVMML